MRRAALLLFLFAWIDSPARACEDHAVWQDPAVREAQRELAHTYELALSASDQKDLLESGQRAWDDYRQLNCELMSAREGEPALEPFGRCIAVMARERTFELRLLGHPSFRPSFSPSFSP